MTGLRVVPPRSVVAAVVDRRMTSGRNQPVLLRTLDDEGNQLTCVVKLRPRLAGPPNEYLFEWLGAAIARRIGLAVPEPLAVTISPALASAADGAIANELHGSVGLVFGSRYVKAITSMAEHRLHSTHSEVAALILGFDVFIHNADRRAANPNLLISGTQIVVFDHELAFGFLFTVGAPDPATDHCPDIVKNHALQAALRVVPPKPADIRGALALVSDEFLADLVVATPVEWTVGPAHGKLEQIVEVLKRRAGRRRRMASEGARMREVMKHPFQAVIVRYSGNASSGEWLNIGVVLLSHGEQFLRARFVDSWARVTAAFPETDPVHLRRVVSTIAECCAHYYAGEHDPKAGIERVFDAILPREDASLMRSAAISGIAEDPSKMLNQLYESYVGAQESNRPCRNDDDVWLVVSKHLHARGVIDRMLSARVEGRHYALEFDHAWQNGRWNVAQALSFDLRHAEEITTKAADWTGRIAALGREHGTDIHLIIGMPPSDAPEDVKNAALHAEALLREQLESTERAVIVREDSAEAFAERVAKEIQAHEAAE